ncbi:MAG TPA: hypothetical protein DEQ03_15885 [Marinilabiliales bacterium]|nr:hypothetical protein [Marinilabiliales bacterium]
MKKLTVSEFGCLFVWSLIVSLIFLVTVAATVLTGEKIYCLVGVIFSFFSYFIFLYWASYQRRKEGCKKA